MPVAQHSRQRPHSPNFATLESSTPGYVTPVAQHTYFPSAPSSAQPQQSAQQTAQPQVSQPVFDDELEQDAEALQEAGSHPLPGSDTEDSEFSSSLSQEPSMSDSDETALGFKRGDNAVDYLAQIPVVTEANSNSSSDPSDRKLISKSLAGCGSKERKVAMK